VVDARSLRGTEASTAGVSALALAAWPPRTPLKEPFGRGRGGGGSNGWNLPTGLVSLTAVGSGAGAYHWGFCPRDRTAGPRRERPMEVGRSPHTAPRARPTGPPSRPATLWQTTGVLTAAMLVYALGAGITAAAGTRLALQLILITVFGLHPFQVPLVKNTSGIAAVRRCLAGWLCIGQFARLLPALAVVAISQAPSPESNPNSPSPVEATVVHYTTVPADRSEVHVIKRCCCGRGHHSLCQRDRPGGTSLSQPRHTALGWGAGLRISWAQSAANGQQIAGKLCCGRPGRTCISHKVLEDVQLGTWRRVGADHTLSRR